MSDFEEGDFFWERWNSPEVRKRKWDSKKVKKEQKHENSATMNVEDGSKKKKKKKKKKKSSKFKEAMERMKEKKKGKKKNKKGSSLGLDDSFLFTEGDDEPDFAAQQTRPAFTTEGLNPCGNEDLQSDPLTQCPIAKKKTKRKKKVAFDLPPPGYIHVKRPKLTSSAPQFPEESAGRENGAANESERWSHVPVTGQSHRLPQDAGDDDDTQGTADDINSQDLFITQKTFGASRSDTSSGEADDKAFTTNSLTLTQQDGDSQIPLTQGAQQGSDRNMEDPQRQKLKKSPKVHHHPNRVKDHLKDPSRDLATEDKDGLYPKFLKPRGRIMSADTQRQLTLSGKKKESITAKPKAVNAFLAEPIVVKSSPDLPKSNKHSSASSQRAPSDATSPPPPTASISTQTENFFTNELSSFLKFCRKSRGSVRVEDAAPLDLSLAPRARTGAGTLCPAKTSVFEISDDDDDDKQDEKNAPSIPGKIRAEDEPGWSPPCYSERKDGKGKTEPRGRYPGAVCGRGKTEATPSPQYESEPKSTDTTTSSEDNEPHGRSSKVDVVQVRAVQMRLNENFFFKTKGEGQSPRPESPLMKLAQGREAKIRKYH